jgi:LuxR family maltose regulon positive regulatory protein
MNTAVRPGIAGCPTVRGGIISRRELFGRLGGAARVTQISAPPGSGKTFLLRSWIAGTELADSVAWVPVQGEERDPQRFWISVADALRRTSAGSALVQPLTAAPEMDAWAVVERLLKDLAALEDQIWLVIDDLHEAGSADVLRQLELLVLRAPPELRFVLTTRRDLRLGLHRLRLEGELTEIRAADLRFSVDEARSLFQAAGVKLPDSALTLLVQRTEGWAAGLRLAALSLAGHPDPERFAAEFSGSERTVASYLLAEVLERQSEPVRRLLLRTSVLDRISGELADQLIGGSGAERVLQDLEEAGAFVMSLDARRSWFRYHRLFADLLQLELRRAAPDEIAGLHRGASRWFAEYGYPVQAVRHAQAAQDWGLAARLLMEHVIGLYLDGQAQTLHELLAGFPAEAVTTDAELAALLGGDKLIGGSPEAAERYLALAADRSASVPAERRGRFQVLLAILRLSAAQGRGDLPVVAEEARRLVALAEDPDVQPGLGQDLRALALVNLGIAELWALQADDAERHLGQGAALAHQIGRPFLEVNAMAHGAWAASFRSFALAVERSSQAIELARRHGWTEAPFVAVPYTALGAISVWQARLEEAESMLDHAECALRAETEPAAGLVFYQARGMLALARGRDTDALAAFHAADRLAGF